MRTLRERGSHRARAWWLPVLAVLLAVALLFGIAIGPVQLTLWQVARAMLHPNGSSTADIIVGAIREPRMLCAAVVGAALSVSGAVVQAIFKNPMADPGIIGVSAGGALGAVFALAMSWTVWSPFLLPLAAFITATAAVFLVYGLATRRGKTSLIGVLLAGMVVSSMLSAGLSLILIFANNDELRGIVFWLMGGFSGDSWTQVWLVAIPVAIGLTITLFLSRELDLLQTGEDNAHSSGVRVELIKRLLIALTALMTGAAVAISGVIAFVGLIVPHIVRRLVGPRHALVLPASALFGAALLVAAETLARSAIPTMEINVGIVTSFIGGPFFLYLLLRTERMRSS
ncbi:MAG: iron ABC transporter permease [Firmicutes bacterium]|nr:iron ABC transporter permease [Bacillota bacterium]